MLRRIAPALITAALIGTACGNHLNTWQTVSSLALGQTCAAQTTHGIATVNGERRPLIEMRNIDDTGCIGIQWCVMFRTVEAINGQTDWARCEYLASGSGGPLDDGAQTWIGPDEIVENGVLESSLQFRVSGGAWLDPCEYHDADDSNGGGDYVLCDGIPVP